MAKKMLIDATHAEETRVVVVDGNKVEEFDFESENKRQLAGNIYLAKVTRVEPSLQAAFVDYGGNRHGFLAFSEIHPDYYQIPVADREVLMEEERAYVEAMKARDEEEATKSSKSRRSRSRSRSKTETKAEKVEIKDAVETKEVAGEVSGMETIDFGDGEDSLTPEGTSPIELVAETPVEEPLDTAATESDKAGDTVAENAVTSSETPGAIGAGDDVAEAEEADDDSNDEEKPKDASSKDASIESVADEDDSEEIRRPRKPRPRRYKIQEVIKVRQILLVQVVKEERGNKGAALTTYLSLAGRYCVLMPNTARGGGISRKITNATDRKKLKEIANEIDVPTGAGLIVRTAGAKRTKTEIKRDYEYLQRLWEQIRELTLNSIAPAKIYEEGDLIKRSIRDLYSREIDEVLVEGERGYRIAKDFMKMIMPSHAKNVKQYGEAMPLFARYQVESYLSSMFNPTVQLRSGGYIVIGVTEALVAIDVNSGRATKESSIEETALKTNLEAAEEVARQLRLRDLAGLIVIDFIDMDERKNNSAVEKRMKDKLKTDRARIQVGRISGFGLMEMSRQRLRPGMIEATTQPCPSCHGTGLIRSDDNLALSILRQIEEEGTRRRSREVLVKCPVGIANFLMNQKREHVAQIEARYGLSVRIEGDPMLISPDFALEKFKTATRVVPERVAPVVSVDTSLMEQIDSDAEAGEETVAEDGSEEAKPKKRRRRRRRSKSSTSTESTATEAAEDGEDTTASAEESAEGADKVEEDAGKAENRSEPSETASQTQEGDTAKPEENAPKAKPTTRKRSTSTKTTSKSKAEETVADTESTGADVVEAEDTAEAAPTKKTKAKKTTTKASTTKKTTAKKSTSAKTKKTEDEEKPVEVAAAELPEDVAQTPAEPVTTPTPEPAAEPVAVVEAAPEPEAAVVEPEVSEPPKPKRKGWWSLSKG
ncbi:MAG: ribonuclease E/G [Rhodobacterales bacterium]|nr:MAG: ribonuclease E/G [Rhodobacterales bacterium]